MIINCYLPGLMMIMGIFTYASNRKHLLSMLLSLEYIVLSLFYLLFIYLNLMDYESYFSVVYVTFSVCEGVLGLSILVSMILMEMIIFNLLVFYSVKNFIIIIIFISVLIYKKYILNGSKYIIYDYIYFNCM